MIEVAQSVTTSELAKPPSCQPYFPQRTILSDLSITTDPIPVDLSNQVTNHRQLYHFAGLTKLKARYYIPPSAYLLPTCRTPGSG